MAKRKLIKKVTHKLGIISNFDKAIETENIIAKIEPLRDEPCWHDIKNTHTGETKRIRIYPNSRKSVFYNRSK